MTTTPPDNSEWIDHILTELGNQWTSINSDTFHETMALDTAQLHWSREQNKAKAQIIAKLREAETRARIDELENFQWNEAHRYVDTRLAELRSPQGEEAGTV